MGGFLTLRYLVTQPPDNSTEGLIRNSHRAILCRGFIFVFRRPLKRPLGPEGVTR